MDSYVGPGLLSMDSAVKELHSQAQIFAAQFDQGGRTTSRYIDEAIALDREAVKLCPPKHHMRTSSLTWLSIHLFSRYEQFGEIADLDEAIILDREALELCPQGHPDRPMSLNNLAVDISTRYSVFGAIADLNEAIVLDREALELRPQGHPDRSLSLNSLANRLSTRYDKFGAVTDLDEAVALDQEALELRPQGHPDRPSSLNNLSNRLSTRYNKFGAIMDLNEAIVLDREALELRPQGHPDRPASLNNFAVRLSIRYDQLGAIRDLDEAIVLDREALALRPRGHPDHSMSLDNLGNHLVDYYKKFGAISHLDEAIVLGQEALELRPHGHPDRPASLNNLAVRLSTRYGQLGAIRDLDEAIVLDREALKMRPQGHPDRSKSLNNLAVGLSTRYNNLGIITDLDEAIVFNREALELRPQGHPHRSLSLNGLADRLSARYDKFNNIVDLDEATVLAREALRLCPQGHPDRSASLHNLADRLSTRYSKFRNLADLDEAIVLEREALELRVQGHPDRSMSLKNLASRLSNRYNHSSTKHDFGVSLSNSPTLLGDQEEIFSLYAQLADVSQTVTPNDLNLSRVWICAAESYAHPSTILAYETSLRLLVEYLSLLPSLPEHLVVLRKHAASLAVDAFSACLRNSAPKRAVELLEQGRSVFWNQLTRLHSSLDNVIASGPEGEILANKFTHLAALIRRALHSPDENQHGQLCHLNLEMESVVSDIRNLPSLSRFLLPSLFSDLQLVASNGPVIIVNASQYGCDALIVTGDQDLIHIQLKITYEHVQLLSTKLRTLPKRANSRNERIALGGILREIWDDIVSPIVCSLRTIIPLRSRIWWCPTGKFSDLPLHAAGPYRQGQSNLPDLYISSYTPTLNALIRARRTHTSRSASPVKRFIAVGQANAVGQNKLLSVNSELARIGRDVGGAAAFKQIVGEESRISRVAEELGKNGWVHFACHGLANRKEPFKSAFALDDGHFSIEQIIRCNLEDPEFAYLSACQTTVGDEESPDESIHLASAMQFIGFRSVIGTMWSVDDEETNMITSTFYKHMFDESGRLDYTRAALALNETMRSLAKRLTIDQQILYIHLGA